MKMTDMQTQHFHALQIRPVFCPASSRSGSTDFYQLLFGAAVLIGLMSDIQLQLGLILRLFLKVRDLFLVQDRQLVQ